MDKVSLLWVDDEIDLLKPQIMFLEGRGYEVTPVTNGQDAVDKCDEFYFDIVFLDENMPGLSGLETLAKIKEKDPNIPVVMVTKNEAEDLMDQAIGSQISDYLIKPVKPQQILLSIKKLIDNKRLVREKNTSDYQQEFQKIMMQLQENLDHESWVDVYRKLVYWELELGNSNTSEMAGVLSMQKQEANVEFNKFVLKNYLGWLNNEESAPVMSHTLFKKKVFPELVEGLPTFVIVIDNLRYDQFKMIQPLLMENFRLNREECFYSILPTCTQYSRNAIFSGLMPSEIAHRHPEYWRNDDDEGGKNMFEAELLMEQLKRNNLTTKYSYVKVTNHESGRSLEDNILNMLNNDLNVIVYNFVDMLSHARTEMEVLKELASDEAAYRSLTLSWFDHSPLHNALKKLADKDINLIITTDHGTVRVKTPSKCIGDRNTTSNLRYKMGKNLNYNVKDVLEVRNPDEAFLPKSNLSSSYIFAKEDKFFVYPNNYNHYVNYFKNTFQHGGISLEEMIVPIAIFNSKG